MTRLDTASTKRIPLLAVMARLGQQPVSGPAAGGNYYFISPFRPDEQTPSFVVSEPKNVWADFGEPAEAGQKVYGGDVLKLIMRLTGVTLPIAHQVLAAWALDMPAATELPLAQPAAKGKTVATGPITFTDVRTEPLTWKALVEYLTSRGINWPLIQRNQRTMEHLQQVFYQVQGKERGKPYFALGWKTEGGWEVRSKGFQGTIGQKGVTWLHGTEPGVNIFEGFMDYLSALTCYRVSSFRSTVLILNSVNLLGSVLPLLMEQDGPIRWFGDNDAAGERALHVLREALPGRVQVQNELYRGYKDLNDFLTKTPPTKPLPPKRDNPSAASQTAKYWLWAVFDELAPGQWGRKGKRRQCTFYSYTNDDDGLEQLRVLRNQLGHQLYYYRICERTQGRKFKILEHAGLAHAVPQVDESDREVVDTRRPGHIGELLHHLAIAS
ncbi:toprim domain-containing protein [Hymenobacter sp. B81]|uniref:toprim domain-containing protein n=1 Tax=Hymenobacter sp. B81 TaxID=3344878 RepID=UPI0037DDDD35